MRLDSPSRACTLLVAMLAGIPGPLVAQTAGPDRRGAFVSYEITEMVVNDFRHFAGEAGFRFGRRHQARLTVMEVAVTERDLSGWWSAAVEGDSVAGYLRVYEASLDRFFRGNWYAGINAGYIGNEFHHVALPERIRNETLTAGIAFGYSRSRVLGIGPLHINFTVPVRYYFHGIPETRLGGATVRAHRVVPNAWLFIGYMF